MIRGSAGLDSHKFLQNQQDEQGVDSKCTNSPTNAMLAARFKQANDFSSRQNIAVLNMLSKSESKTVTNEHSFCLLPTHSIEKGISNIKQPPTLQALARIEESIRITEGRRPKLVPLDDLLSSKHADRQISQKK